MDRLFYKSSWVWRRTMVFMIVTTGLLSLLYLTWSARDAASVSLVGGIWQALIMAIGGSYIFGAVWDDRNSMSHGRVDAAAPPDDSGRG